MKNQKKARTEIFCILNRYEQPFRPHNDPFVLLLVNGKLFIVRENDWHLDHEALSPYLDYFLRKCQWTCFDVAWKVVRTYKNSEGLLTMASMNPLLGILGANVLNYQYMSWTYPKIEHSKIFTYCLNKLPCRYEWPSQFSITLGIFLCCFLNFQDKKEAL